MCAWEHGVGAVEMGDGGDDKDERVQGALCRLQLKWEHVIPCRRQLKWEHVRTQNDEGYISRSVRELWVVVVGREEQEPAWTTSQPKRA